MIHPALLTEMYTQTYDVIKRQTAGATHEESLRPPPAGGNCLN